MQTFASFTLLYIVRGTRYVVRGTWYGLLLLVPDNEDTSRADEQEHACHYHHGVLMTAYGMQDKATNKCCHNLRHTDGTVEQAEIGTHVTVTLQSIGDKGERHGQHGSPGTANEHERQEEHILVGNERHHSEADASQHKTQRISQLGILELRQNGCPDNTTYSLNGKEYTLMYQAVFEDQDETAVGIMQRWCDQLAKVQ